MEERIIMDKFAGDSQSNQPYFNHFFEQIKNLMSNLNSAEQPSPSVSAATNLPLQSIGTSSMANTRSAFMAFPDAIIPSTFGALDLRLDDYLIWTLDHIVSIHGEWGIKSFPLSFQTARILDIAAMQLMVSGNIKAYPDYSANPDGGPFAALSPDDRFEAIRLLENLHVDLEVLPSPYRNNGGLVKNIVTALHQTVLFGYYSEWFALGSTRLAYPENHNLERQRFLWDTLNYPGPSFGYRAVRGFLVDKFSE
jgi:hypothetical protein